jgi:LmbE family N-acetylglucosaminyl deacetylase
MAETHGDTVALAVGAHPDDIEEFCGGTLALLARKGVPVHMACLTGGESGIANTPPEEVRRIRLDEAARSAEIAGAAGFHFLGLHDFELDPTAVARSMAELVRLIRRVRANLLFAHADGDYHADHRVVHRLVTEARIAASVANVDDEAPLERDPDLVYLDTAGGVAF